MSELLCSLSWALVTKSWKNHNTVQTFSHLSRQTAGKRDNERIISCSFATQNFPIFWIFPTSLRFLTSQSIKIFLFVWAASISQSSRQHDRKTVITKVFLSLGGAVHGFLNLLCSYCHPAERAGQDSPTGGVYLTLNSLTVHPSREVEGSR